jgi:hypothetical protein
MGKNESRPLGGRISDRIRNGDVEAEVNPPRPNTEGTENTTPHEGHRPGGRGK